MKTTERRKIAIVTSTRADWGLLQPVAEALSRRQDVDLRIIATNMHLDPSRGMTVNEIIADGFEIAARVEMTPADDSPASAVEAMSRCMKGMAEALTQVGPDLLLILGDRYEMLAVASAATVLGIPIAHISGGEITEGAIDDNIRHAISKLSSLHFATTESHRRRLIAMGEGPERVMNVGALGVANIHNVKLFSREELERSLGFKITNPSVLVTFHPATTDPADPRERFGELLTALEGIGSLQVIFTCPNNDPRSDALIEMIHAYARRHEDARVVPSLGRLRYLSALQYVDAVVGNSSSGIVEVPSAHIPTVDVGCRQRGRCASASVIHCGDTRSEIADALKFALSAEGRRIAREADNPYDRQQTVERIVGTLATVDVNSLLPKHFHDVRPDETIPQVKTEASANVSHTDGFKANPLVIIPARGGSKGIPHKNIVPLCGRPLLAYTVDVAKEVADLRHIVLSTDDEEIAAVGRECGLKVDYRRPPSLATDTAGSREVILDAMDWADRQQIDYNCVVLLQPTSPLRAAEDVENALSRYAPDCDMVVSVKEASANPYYNCFETRADGCLEISKGDGLLTRRQDAPPAYEYNGAVYVINPQSVREMPLGAFPRRIPQPMPAERSVDIDTPLDLLVAEAIMSQSTPGQ